MGPPKASRDGLQGGEYFKPLIVVSQIFIPSVFMERALEFFQNFKNVLSPLVAAEIS